MSLANACIIQHNSHYTTWLIKTRTFYVALTGSPVTSSASRELSLCSGCDPPLKQVLRGLNLPGSILIIKPFGNFHPLVLVAEIYVFLWEWELVPVTEVDSVGGLFWRKCGEKKGEWTGGLWMERGESLPELGQPRRVLDFPPGFESLSSHTHTRRGEERHTQSGYNSKRGDW